MCSINQKIIFNSGGAELLLHAMRRFSTNEELCFFCCSALGNLAANHSEAADEIVERGGTQLIVEVMYRFLTSPIENVRCVGCFALESLVTAASKQTQQIVRVPHVIGIARRIQSSPSSTARSKLAKALSSLRDASAVGNLRERETTCKTEFSTGSHH